MVLSVVEAVVEAVVEVVVVALVVDLVVDGVVEATTGQLYDKGGMNGHSIRVVLGVVARVVVVLEVDT